MAARRLLISFHPLRKQGNHKIKKKNCSHKYDILSSAVSGGCLVLPSRTSPPVSCPISRGPARSRCSVPRGGCRNSTAGHSRRPSLRAGPAPGDQEMSLYLSNLLILCSSIFNSKDGLLRELLICSTLRVVSYLIPQQNPGP